MRKMMAVILVLAVDAAFAASTAFLNVNVVPMTEDRVIEAQTVIVVDGRITVIGDVDTVPVPEDATVVDGTDRFLMPGLAEMHAHVPDIGSDNLDRVFTLFVANGVTMVRGMLGRPSHLVLRQQLRDGEQFGPHLITSGPSLNGNSVNGPAHGAQLVRSQHAAGYDFLKIHPGLTARISTAREVTVGSSISCSPIRSILNRLTALSRRHWPPERGTYPPSRWSSSSLMTPAFPSSVAGRRCATCPGRLSGSG
jgi:hypothetical protein